MELKYNFIRTKKNRFDLYDKLIAYLSERHNYKDYDVRFVVNDLFNDCEKISGFNKFGDKCYLVDDECDIAFAKGYDRLVRGRYGIYLEISESDIIKDNIKPSKSQEKRKDFENRKYDDYRVGYGNGNLKIYHQRRSVDYADYKPGYYYVGITENIRIESLDEK